MRIISGAFKGRILQRPPESITRPTSDRVRESVFNVLLHLNSFDFEGAYVLDLFAGSGAMGLEALSRGAKMVLFVDRNPIARQVITQNVRHLKVDEKAYIASYDALSLPKANNPANLIFIDPPYLQGLEEKVLKELALKNWMKQGTIIVLETSRKTKIDFPSDTFTLLTSRAFSNTTISILQKI